MYTGKEMRETFQTQTHHPPTHPPKAQWWESQNLNKENDYLMQKEIYFHCLKEINSPPKLKGLFQKQISKKLPPLSPNLKLYISSNVTDPFSNN